MGADRTHAPGVAFVNLGCRVNRVETDGIAATLEGAGCQLVDEDEAQAIVINTCAVTAEAEAKTRKVVRHAAGRAQGPVVVATGCVASLFAPELADLGSNVVVEPDKSRVAATVLDELRVAGWEPEGSLDVAAPTPTGRSRPGIKVQDGCDNRCTYCIVWKARGAGRSVPVGQVLREVDAAVGRGAHEVVLTGINLGRYQSIDDSGREVGLPGLLTRILEDTDVDRVRLSSLEPPDVDAELLGIMAAYPERVAPFLHVCLQSGCDRTLQRMGRVYDTSFYRSVVEAAREALPGVALGCDLIVGFPGETDQDFQESLDFCRQMDFAKMHVFRYSRRPGTPAATMPNQVDPRVMSQRSSRMREAAQQMRCAQAALHVGSEELVVVEYVGRGVTGGLFDVLVDPSLPVGSLVRVRVRDCRPDGTLVGEVPDAC